MSKFIDYDNETHRELALMAIAGSATMEDAKEFLQAEHQLLSTPTKLEWIRDHYTEQFEELRQAVAPLKEQTLAHNLLDNAVYASEVTKVAMEQLLTRMQEDRVKTEYLSRVARDIADVQSKSVEKRALIEGKPTVIKEDRDAGEIIRALESKGIVKQIEAGDD